MAVCATKFVPLRGLDMSKFVTEASPHKTDSSVYDLFAVSNHVGESGLGHCTCTALNESSGQWCHFDDHTCTPVQPGAVVSAAAYMLLYRRRQS